jgi:hypothetical protein
MNYWSGKSGSREKSMTGSHGLHILYHHHFNRNSDTLMPSGAKKLQRLKKVKWVRNSFIHARNRAYILSTTKPHLIVYCQFIPCPSSPSFNTASTVFFLHLEHFLQASARDTSASWWFSPHNSAIEKKFYW